jgi:tripartite-type tricarboxylate transporter receptor subunit TctC
MRRVWPQALLAGVLILGAANLAASEDYPARFIKLIVPGLAGGGVDIVARLIEPGMTQNFGQKVVIDDRAGGNATLGAALVAHADPDGYAILISTSGPIINALGATITYNAETSFAPISRVMTSPFFLVVPESSPFRTVADLVAAGRDLKQVVRYGHPGAGTTTHLATALLNQMAGTHFVDIPYHGAAEQAADTIKAQLQFGLLAAPDALSRRDAGLRILAVTSAKRSILAPDIPTIAESGVPGYEAELWHGLFAPAGTPRPIIERIRHALVSSLNDDTARQRFRALAMIPAADTPEEFAAVVDAERKSDLALAKALNLQMP